MNNPDVKRCRRSRPRLVLGGLILLTAGTLCSAQTTAQTPQGLHIPEDRPIQLTHVFRDGKGFNWDIEYDGGAENGTNYIYDNSMLLLLTNAQSPFVCQTAWINRDGNEVELGPFPVGNLRVYRRIRVYGDRPLARWLEILVNESGEPVQQRVGIRMETNNNIRVRGTSDGDSDWEDNDWYLTTETYNGGSPSLLSILCGSENAPVHPSVEYQGSYTSFVSYDVTVPPRKAVVICHFESQANSLAEFQAVTGTFDINDLLSDLPGSVRAIIANFRVGGLWSDVRLTRSDKADMVVLANGDVIYGAVSNPQFEMTAFFGDVTIPAEKLIGMAMHPGAAGLATVALADGQVLFGRIRSEVLNVTISTGGQLQVPLQRVEQWAYKIDDARSDGAPASGPMALLRTGDRIAFDPAATSLELFTAYGKVPLRGQDLVEVRFDNPSHMIHQVVFTNESTLTGILEPRELHMKLALGPEVTLPRDMIGMLVFTNPTVENPLLTTVTMANGDVLSGRETGERLDLAGDYGDQILAPENLSKLEFSPDHPGRVAMSLWDGTLLRGEIRQMTFPFQIFPGPELSLPVSQIQTVQRAAPMAPQELSQQVEDLLIQLGAESYQDREQAQAALIQMGPTILPLLTERQDNDDPEVRERLQQIIQQLQGGQP